MTDDGKAISAAPAAASVAGSAAGFAGASVDPRRRVNTAESETNQLVMYEAFKLQWGRRVNTAETLRLSHHA